jgi:signal peptide peptidase SppA
MRNLRIAELIFNRPLMISETKLNTILHILGPRFSLNMSGLPAIEAAQISDRERQVAGYQAKGGVGFVGIYGPLLHRVMASDYPSGGPTTYSDIRRAFDLAMVDDDVHSIVMDIDSPGGEGNGVFDLSDHIFNARGTKPITAIVNESAFSAAYALASSADRIILPRTGMVGSVGVIATHADLSRAEEAAGITVTHVYAGARKADFSPHQPLSPDALAWLQGSVNDMYEMFVDLVARNRRMTTQAVRETEAGIYEGKKAVKAGLADEVAPVDVAIAKASRTRAKRTISAQAGKENKIMKLEDLRNENPDLVAEIERAARVGMVVQADVDTALATAVTAERSRILDLHAATHGEEAGEKFAAVVTAGLNAEQVKALGVTVGPTATLDATVDEASRAAILQGLKDSAPEGLKNAKPAGEQADRAAAVSAIAAGGSKK